MMIAGLSGCLSMKSYVDPVLPKTGKGDLVVAPCDRRIDHRELGVAGWLDLAID